jgi:N-acetylmuramoyl-L-alanine amidase
LIVKSLPDQMVEALSVSPLDVARPTSAVSMPVDFPSDRIGIVVGHRGNENDKGAVCSDGLTELDVNTNVATYVQQKLIKAGYTVDLLDEFDPRLNNYQAGLLLSIHSDSCDYINESATGFKVAAALAEQKQDNSLRLVECIADRYAKATGLKYHYQSITQDMTYYHAYSEINAYTVAGIIEVGFLNLDKEILTTKPELLADGIVSGISCYMNNEATTLQPTE